MKIQNLYFGLVYFCILRNLCVRDGKGKEKFGEKKT